jgi:hypothetical protein
VLGLLFNGFFAWFHFVYRKLFLTVFRQSLAAKPRWSAKAFHIYIC